MSVWPKISDIVKSVSDGRVSATENVNKALKLIEEKNPEYSAVVSVIESRAIARAEEIDKRIAKGENVGRLAGVPFIVKDNYLSFDSETTASSNMLKGFRAPYQATAIEKLEAEGAILVAKANLDAFAHGTSTENSDLMVTKNPHDKERVPGGSSGGSAASVALDLVPFTLGSDTGGSIRQPAAFCGVVGVKPTYGLISRSGVVAMASSTDVLGPLTRNVDDAGLIIDVMSGVDPLDGTTIQGNSEGYSNLNASVKSKKVGVIKEWFGEGLDSGVAEKVKTAIKALEDAGAEVVEVSLPSLDLALAVYYVVVPAELSSNLSRHDGQRYQFSYEGAKDLDESYEQSRSIGFGPEAKRRIMIGTHVLSSGYYDAYYNKAQTVRTKLINEFNQAFSEVDIMVGPITPTTAFKIGELSDDPLQLYLQDIYTVSANLVGVPAISIPCGEIDGLPVGLQLLADQNNDRILLEAAKAYEEINS